MTLFRERHSSRSVVLNEVKHLFVTGSKRLFRYTFIQTKMTLRSISVIVAPTFLLTLLLPQTLPAETLRIPYVSISGFQAPLYLGERAGLFKKNQLEAQLIYMPGGSLIVQTLLSGGVGVASLAPPSAVAAWVKGAELAVVAGGIERALNVLMVNRKIKTPGDLKGKRVAISRFGSALDSIPEATNTKLNLDSLIDNSLIQELQKEGFIRERYPEKK